MWKCIFKEYEYNDIDDQALLKIILDGFSWIINWYFDKNMDKSSKIIFSIWFYHYNNALN
jgi:hypothetical protein